MEGAKRLILPADGTTADFDSGSIFFIGTATVQEILEEMSTIPEKYLIAFNKVDQVDSETLAQAQQKYPQSVFISATERLGLETLKQCFLQMIDAPVGMIQL
ncbi:MAG: hypothetical protein AB3A66_10365 [Nodularia sp. CChRGM 3473]